MMSDLLTGPSYSVHSKVKKLIVMLHGYGDTAENFIYISNQLDQEEWGAQYISLNAPETIPNYPMGNQLKLMVKKSTLGRKTWSSRLRVWFVHSVPMVCKRAYPN